jgi:hypothetical protein
LILGILAPPVNLLEQHLLIMAAPIVREALPRANALLADLEVIFDRRCDVTIGLMRMNTLNRLALHLLNQCSPHFVPQHLSSCIMRSDLDLELLLHVLHAIELDLVQLRLFIALLFRKDKEVLRRGRRLPVAGSRR